MKTSVLGFLCLLLFSQSCFARQECVMAVPKCGTHYFAAIIRHITGKGVFEPTVPNVYRDLYLRYRNRPPIVIGHPEPLVMNMLSQFGEERTVVLVRDPRDMALSARDYIYKRGVAAWPGLEMSQNDWEQLSLKEQLDIIIMHNRGWRDVSAQTVFEGACALARREKSLVVKYEELVPCYPDAARTVCSIAEFFGYVITEERAEEILELTYGVTTRTFNKGEIERYKKELSPELQQYVTDTLKNYIKFFGYPVSSGL
ncbi:MAG: sulfotransferase domain-containing protein [Chlamydiales bacterium]